MGDAEVVLTGGTDNMSACPYAVRDIRYLNIGREPDSWILNNFHTKSDLRKVLYSINLL